MEQNAAPPARRRRRFRWRKNPPAKNTYDGSSTATNTFLYTIYLSIYLSILSTTILLLSTTVLLLSTTVVLLSTTVVLLSYYRTSLYRATLYYDRRLAAVNGVTSYLTETNPQPKVVSGERSLETALPVNTLQAPQYEA